MFNPEDYSGAGTENLSESAGMPLLSIIQSGSAQFKKSHKDYATKGIAGCQEGDILLNAENRVVKAPVQIIPIKLQKVFVKWTDDNKIEAILPESIMTEDNYRSEKDGNATRHYYNNELVIYTEYWFVKVLEQGTKEFQPAVIALKGTYLGLSTQLSNARKDANRNEQYTKIECKAPIFSVICELSTEPRSNNEGSWFVWKLDSHRVLDFKKDKAILDECAGAYDEVKVLELSSNGNTKQIESDDSSPY